MNGDKSSQESATEFKAGVFVLIGLVFIALMAFKFGRLGQGLFQHYYPITVTFPSADGLIKNSDVELAGARVGYVAEKPVITSGGSGVTIALEILASVKIPRDTTFEVASSGLLGDKFVDIKPKDDFNAKTFDSSDPKQVLAPGDIVPGTPAGGLLGGLGTKGEEVFDELKIEIQKLMVLTDKINSGILSDQNQKNITDTFANLKGTTEHFNLATKDLDSVVLNAQGAIDSAKVTLGTVNSAAGDIHGAIDEAQKTLATARDLIARAETGNGPVATLLNDKEISDNLKALVANLREHGILFYKNKAAASPAPASPQGARADRQF